MKVFSLLQKKFMQNQVQTGYFQRGIMCPVRHQASQDSGSPGGASTSDALGICFSQIETLCLKSAMCLILKSYILLILYMLKL